MPYTDYSNAYGLPGIIASGTGGAGPGTVGGATPGSSHSESQSQQQAQSGQYFNDPNLVNNVSQNLGKVINESAGNYSNFVNNPTSNPAFINSLSGMLAALHPSEMEGVRNLNDTFRAAGNTASSTSADAANKYQQGVDRNHNELASNLLAKLYPEIASAMYAPLSQADALVNAQKMSQSTSSGTSTSQSDAQAYPPSSGGGGGVSSGAGGITDPFANFNFNTSAPGQVRNGGGAPAASAPSTFNVLDYLSPNGNTGSGLPDFGGGADYGGSYELMPNQGFDFTNYGAGF